MQLKDSIRFETKTIQHYVTNASQVQIYPIVLLVKYKTVKQLREVRDPRYLPESLSQKDARHLQVLLPPPCAQSVFVRILAMSFIQYDCNSMMLRKQQDVLKPTFAI